jgi:hypothetical protein
MLKIAQITPPESSTICCSENAHVRPHILHQHTAAAAAFHGSVLAPKHIA